MRTHKSVPLKQLDAIQDRRGYEYRRAVAELQRRAHCEIEDAPSQVVQLGPNDTSGVRISLVPLGDNRTRDAQATEAYFVQWVSGRQTTLADLYVASVSEDCISVPIRFDWESVDPRRSQVLIRLAQHQMAR